MEPDLFLKARRQARGWTLKELSERSRVSASHIGRMERGERSPSLKVAQRINDALKLGPALVVPEDRSFGELKQIYNLPARLVEGIRTVETTQKDKPLQVFDNPEPSRDYHIKWETSELTSLCPKTGQPDFCTLYVDYIPDKSCLELKSAKLYLWSFRQEGHFYEDLVNLIYSDFWEAIKPRFLEVKGRFAVRGGFIEEVVVSRPTEREG